MADVPASSPALTSHVHDITSNGDPDDIKQIYVYFWNNSQQMLRIAISKSQKWFIYNMLYIYFSLNEKVRKLMLKRDGVVVKLSWHKGTKTPESSISYMSMSKPGL